MAEGRYYRIKRLRKRNRFTADTYDAVCSDIDWANIGSDKKQVIVHHAKNKMAGVSSLIREVLKQNNITVKSSGKYASTNVKTFFKFDSRDDASAAQIIINKMANDTVNRNAVNASTGENTTSGGVKIRVDLDRDDNGNVSLAGGTNYVPANSSSVTAASSPGGMGKWLIIGGVALVAIVIVFAVLKKKKIIK